MKKMTFLAALLGVTQLSNAQVGIGTANPADAVQLEISATNKGVLIPRVQLTNTTTFSPITGTAVESLLVYNTATAADVTPGFYYWVNVSGSVAAHWERIVNQTQLDEAIGDITDLQGDVSKIIALLKVAFPANNLVDPTVTGDTFGGGMVFIPGATPTIEYVYFDGTNYVKKDITSDIITIIKGAESKTTFIEFPAASGKYYYISEEAINANNGVVPTSPFSTGTTLRPGVILIDVPQSVISNFQTILDGTTTIVKPGGSFYTVEEIIKMIASQVEGNVIYTNIGTTGAPNWVFQYWSDAANAGAGGYVTINLTDLVGAAQSKTALVKTTNGKKQYFISETYLVANNNVMPTPAQAQAWTTVPAGVYEIDVIGGIINNFEEFITNNPVTVDGNTYNTVEEYIQYISENAMQDGVTKIVIDATTNQASFQQWNKATNTWVNVDNSSFETIVTENETVTTMIENTDGTYTYKNEAGADVVIDIPASVIQELGDIIEGTTTFNNSSATTLVEYIQNMINNTDLPEGTVTAEIVNGNIVFSIIDANGVATVVPSTAFNNIVKANESLTTIGKSTNNSAYSQVLVDPKAVQKVVYEYLTESTTVKNYIDVTADVEWSIENNTNVKNAIEDIVNNLLNQGGNVYFTRTAITAGTPTGQLAIPAFSFYTVNATTGVKELVDIAQTIVNAITNATTVQKQEIKNQLGDTYNTTTVTNTGDTWIDGGKIYVGVYTATVTAGSANVSTINLVPPAGTTALGKIVSIKLLTDDNNIINTSTTDVALSGNNLSFRIGTGNMYNVLSSSNLSVKVVVEFSAQ